MTEFVVYLAALLAVIGGALVVTFTDWLVIKARWRRWSFNHRPPWADRTTTSLDDLLADQSTDPEFVAAYQRAFERHQAEQGRHAGLDDE